MIVCGFTPLVGNLTSKSFKKAWCETDIKVKPRIGKEIPNRMLH